ncbi:N-acetyltransferase domain-containing protein [Trichostrongylus colubriformis]|uniref:Protein NATD1 n=1 Tax=Trichostrongylus colubriformis TaxID=6319 RepID=A0AAN8IJ40_TRICO
MALKVQHSKKAMAFFINLGNGSKAFLQYRELPGRILEFEHTETPFEYQGRGIAKLLVKEGLKYAAENKYKITPTCWYVLNYIEKEATEEERNLSTTESCD